MEAGLGRLDYGYEDMFREITKKLYGDDPDHRTSNVQNEFETSVSYKTEVDEGNGTDGSEDGNWTLDDEPLKGTEGSRIAAYRAATSTWRCYECGDCLGGGPRDMAEHFVDMHSSRLVAEDNERGRLHSSRKDYLSPHELKMEEVVAYLQRLKDKSERLSLPPRRTQETQTIPATLLPVTSSFLLQELPNALPPHLHPNSSGGSSSGGGGSGGSGGSNAMPANAGASTTSGGGTAAGAGGSASGGSGGTTTVNAPTGAGGGGGGGAGGGNNASGKRYTCLYCPYGTDRRDLYTRHENIHREEKPFHCYVCCKPFSRADHVKKHFLRMHREHTYELSRIRRPVGSSCSTPKAAAAAVPAGVQSLDSAGSPNPIASSNNNNNNSSPYPNSIYGKQSQQQPQQQQPPTAQPQLGIPASTYQLQPSAANSVHAASAALYQAASLSSAVVAAANSIIQQQQQQQQPEANAASPMGHSATVAAVAAAARRLQGGGASACNTKTHLKSSGSGSSKANQERRYTCCYCSWSGVDNWCLKRHLNTHLKPFACTLCEYKAARAERLATHVLKVHNRRQCSRCSFLGDDFAQLQMHQLHVHRVNSASVAAAAAAAAAQQQQQPSPAAAAQQPQQQQQQQNQSADRQQQQQQPQQSLSVHPVGGGRPPPGPPVFPASSAAIAPATTVIPPTTILGDRMEFASVPVNAYWEQESSSCEKHFLNQSSERRSRKQSMPRKVIAVLDRPETDLQKPEDDKAQLTAKSNATRRPMLRCLLCPKTAAARAHRTRPYHSRVSLLLHKLWRHPRRSRKSRVKPPAKLRIKRRWTQPIRYQR